MMSNEIYNCARCLKDYNANAYPPVLIDEERYCEDCAEQVEAEAEPTQAEVEYWAAKREREYREHERLCGVLPKGRIRRAGW